MWQTVLSLDEKIFWEMFQNLTQTVKEDRAGCVRLHSKALLIIPRKLGSLGSFKHSVTIS